MKNRVRMQLHAAILAAVAFTTIFTGCTGNTTSDDAIGGNTSYVTEIPTDTETSEVIEIGTNDSDAFSIKYKYWYDNPEVAEAQNEALDSELLQNSSLTGTSFMDVDALPVYTTGENEFILSGRDVVYLNDGKISTNRLIKDLRDSNGNKLYAAIPESAAVTVETFQNLLKDRGITQAETYTERVADTEAGKLSPGISYIVYFNNSDTGNTITSEAASVCISDFLQSYSLGFFNLAESTPKLHIYTAAQEIIIEFVETDESVTINYSTDDTSQTVSKSQISLVDGKLFMSLDAIENYLGYDVEYYDGFINIVTDNCDIISSDTILGPTAWELSSADLNSVDDSIPPVIPEQEITTTDPVADQIAQEREESVPIISTEEAEQHQQDREDRQEMADNTQNYTTEGIPLTTEGDLAEPAKPTENYKLPEGAQLEFTGDASTALLTELPEGCYWTPRHKYENAFTDPAGNVWLNTETDVITNIGSGYYSPDGDYHFSQYEIDAATAANQASQERWDNGPSYDPSAGPGSTISGATDQEIDDVWDAFGW